MGVTSAMNTAGQIQDTFGGGGFARVYVSENTNVSVYGEVCHNYSRLEERKFARYFTRFFFRFLAFLHFLCRNLCVKPEKNPGWRGANGCRRARSEEHTSELRSREKLVSRLLLEKKKNK